MKFLCVECDVPMALKETSGPDNGSMTVIFGCRSCGRQIAMLTNEMETQMVHSLGVKIGGRKGAPAHMETISSSLSGFGGAGSKSEAAENGSHATGVGGEAASGTRSEEPGDSPVEESGGCPFSEMVVGSMGTSHDAGANGGDIRDTHRAEEKKELRWTAEARHRMERIPSFVRPMVERGIEDYARANAVTLVDEEIQRRSRLD
jgi:hypothetical protein